MWCRVYITTCPIEKDINFDKQIVREICLIRSTDVAPTEDNLRFYHNRRDDSHSLSVLNFETVQESGNDD